MFRLGTLRYILVRRLNGFQVSLGERFQGRVKDVCTLTVPYVRAAGYLLMALIGSVILVLAAVAPIVASGASIVLARLARPGYNSTWEWVALGVVEYIPGPSAYVFWPVGICVYTYYAYILLTNVWILLRCCILKARTPSDLRSRLIMWALIAHFRRIFLLHSLPYNHCSRCLPTRLVGRVLPDWNLACANVGHRRSYKLEPLPASPILHNYALNGAGGHLRSCGQEGAESTLQQSPTSWRLAAYGHEAVLSHYHYLAIY